MAVGEVLVLFDGEDLTERGVAARNTRQQQLYEVADRDGIEPLAVRHLLEGFLRAHERLGVRGIERSSRRVGPLLGAPSCVERHQVAEADRGDASRSELR